MKKMWITAALFAMSIPALTQAGEIKGIGAQSCGEWVEDRKNSTHYSALHWLQGFISAYNHYVYRGSNPDGVFGSADYKAMAVWMDNYCQANPLNSPYDGAVELIKELGDRAR